MEATTNPTETVVTATETETVVATPAPENPHTVAIRKGKKGPGTEVVTVASKAEAELVKADLLPSLASGSEVIIREIVPTPIMTYTAWAETRKAAVAAEAARAAAEAKIREVLTPAELAALGK